MLHTDNVLFHEIIRAAHDPDPARAAAYRPFAVSSSRRRVDSAPSIPVATFIARTISRVRNGALTFFDHGAIQRPAPLPCC